MITENLYNLDMESKHLVMIKPPEEDDPDEECPFCETGIMEMNNAYEFELDDKNSYTTSAYICTHCSEHMMSKESMTGLLNELERISGKPYIRVNIDQGVIKKFNLH